MIAVILVAVVVTLSYITLVMTIVAEHAEYRIVNLARQQNAEIATTLYLASLTAYAPNSEQREIYLTKLRRAIERMQERHRVFSLEHGRSEVPEDIRHILRDVYDEQNIDEQMERFLRDAQELLASGGDIADLNQLAADQTTLVPLHARLFEQLRAEAGRAFNRIKLLATVQWLLALTVLAGAVLWILRPMTRLMSDMMREIWRAKVKARQEAAVADATRHRQASFIRTMSHELRTPLNAILGMAQLLGMRSLPPRDEAYAHDIQQAGEHLLRLINNVLDLGTIEAGQVTIRRAPATLDELLERAVTLLRPIAAQKSLDLGYCRAEELSGQYLVDDEHIHQVLVNLIGNAIKFTETGWVEVRAVVGRPEEAGITSVRFEVEDTGIGVPADKRESIFEEFQQGDYTLARGCEGTGLGLAICRGLVHLMGGTIGLDSEREKGSLFWFTLPLERASTAASG